MQNWRFLLFLLWCTVAAQDLAAADPVESHWAFQPIRLPQLPVVKNANRVRSPIDRFVLARLERTKLGLSPRADRVTLIRRAYFDLLGLPPTPKQVAAFVTDDSPRAFANLVNRLLASPHYGERWGRYWLDVARYADNKGYVFFEEKRFPWAWTYRDYVIRSLNEDLPFDRFVLEQLAADQLDLGDDRRALAAMGFLTLGPRFMNNAHDVIDDRIDLVSRGLMGLTVGCARCHDHKYDPIPQQDYYSLYGVFRSSVEPMLAPEFVPAADSDQYRKFRTGMQERLKKLDDFIAAQRTQIVSGTRSRVSEYLVAVHKKRNQPDTENFMLLTDKGALNPALIHRWEVYLKRAKRDGDPVWTIWHAFAGLPDEGFVTVAARMQTTLLGESATKKINPLVRTAFAPSPPESMAKVVERYVALLAKVEQDWQQQLKVAKDAGGDAPQRLENDAAEALRQVFYGPKSPAMIPRELSWGFLDLLPDRPTQGEFKKLLKEVETWSMNQPGAPPRAMVLADSQFSYDPVIFQRGNPNREGVPVPRRFLSVLSGKNRKPFTTGSGRLELARAIIDPKNPLTARVFVNRVWMNHFGRGLVGTPSDFGIRGELPSHPELLDWLAVTFIKDGWSVKQLHRTIMNSAVYQQASGADNGERKSIAAQADPENRLLWRFPRRRLDFEATRDSLLTVTGALDRKVGGSPVDVVKGFTPRRTIYGFVDRMNLPGLMRTFDFPEPAATCPQRVPTTVAPQALFFMNNEFTYECARRLLRRADITALTNRDERISRIYRVLFSRIPQPEELAIARVYLKPAAAPVTARVWSYGYGTVDESTMRVKGFTKLIHWTGSRWQGGPRLPDPKIGWVFIDRNGGHPAATLERCVIRRWTAPAAGRIVLSGRLKHGPMQGNGVRARIVSSRNGLLGEWVVHHSTKKTSGITTNVEPGDTLDFVVDFNGEILHDEHEWPVAIRLTPANGSSDTNQPTVWDSQKDFRGGGHDRWIDYVHALLMTNEFVFVD